jgi:hypothetical protein
MDNLINIEQNEADFQKAWDDYWHTDTHKHDEAFYKKCMDNMWMCVFYTCTNLCKKIYKDRCVIVSDLDEVILDSTEYTMRFLTGKNRGRKLYKPESLKSFCFLRCRHVIDDPKRIWHDQHICEMPEDNYKDIDMEIEGDYYA